MSYNRFKKRFELFAYSLVYLGYFIQIIAFAGENEKALIWLMVGFFGFGIFFMKILYSPVIIFIHHLAYALAFMDMVESQMAKCIYFICFIPYYIVLLYFFTSPFFDEKFRRIYERK